MDNNDPFNRLRIAISVSAIISTELELFAACGAFEQHPRLN